MDYYDIFSEPINMRGISHSYEWVESLPAQIWYTSGQFQSKNQITQDKSIIIKSPIKLSNNHIIWSEVEFKVEVRESTLVDYYPIRILSSPDEPIILNALNNLEPDSFWTETEFNKKTYDSLIKRSKIKVFQGEGQSVRNGKLLLGTKIGPNRHEITALIHEISHLIEIDDERVLKQGWGFSYGVPQTIFGRVYYNPTTYQASLRECRVIAIQHILQLSVGIETSLQEQLVVLEHMSDWSLIPTKNKEYSIKEGFDQRISFLLDYTEKYLKTLSLDNILNKWERKQSLL
jgi:hypothetical protein